MAASLDQVLTELAGLRSQLAACKCPNPTPNPNPTPGLGWQSGWPNTPEKPMNPWPDLSGWAEEPMNPWPDLIGWMDDPIAHPTGWTNAPPPHTTCKHARIHGMGHSAIICTGDWAGMAKHIDGTPVATATTATMCDPLAAAGDVRFSVCIADATFPGSTGVAAQIRDHLAA